MDPQLMLSVQNLTKSFKLYAKPSDRLKEMVLRRPCHSRHLALNNLNFEVARGEALGILGRNGAGKSTLLKLLTGVMVPDSGDIAIEGKLTGLLELGTGFDFAQTGRSNLVTNGLLVGLTHEEIEQKRDAIIAFSELGRYIEEPLRTYSSGMVMRLAFSIAIHANPDIFLIDEALSVGDGHFQQKCMRKIKEFRARGGSIVFVSHDLNAVKMLCDRAIVLDNGVIVTDSEPETAVNRYNQLLGTDDAAEAYVSEAEEKGYGSFEAKLESVELLGAESQSTIMASGEEVRLNIDLSAQTALSDVTLGFVIRDRFGQDIFGTNTHLLEHSISLSKGENRTLSFSMPMTIAPGKYTLTAALHEGMDHTRHCYHWWDNVVSFEVAGIKGASFGGICDLSPSILEPVTQSIPNSG